jgi:hypothetical protein
VGKRNNIGIELIFELVKKCDRNGVPQGSTVGPLLFAKKGQCVVRSGVRIT